MKRMTMIVGLFLIGLLLSSSLWAGLTGVDVATANEAPQGVRAVQSAPQASHNLAPLQVATAVSIPHSDAVITVDDLNLRSGPGISFNERGNYPEGTPLIILGQGRDGDNMPWLYVQTPDGKKGWMSARPTFQTTSYIRINVPISEIPFVNPPAPTPVRIDAVVAVDDLNMRSGPGLHNEQIGKYAQGTPLDVLGQSPDRDGMPWLYVQTPDGKKGWMSARPTLNMTPYMEINIAHSQIMPWSDPAAAVEFEEIDFDTPVFAPATIAGATVSIAYLRAVSCQNPCKISLLAPQVHSAGSDVCLRWFEMGTVVENDKIGLDLKLDGNSIGSKTLPAQGDKLCRAIRMNLADAGQYEALITAKKVPFTHNWTVD